MSMMNRRSLDGAAMCREALILMTRSQRSSDYTYCQVQWSLRHVAAGAGRPLTCCPQSLTHKPSPTVSQWFRAQFGPILVYTKCQMFSFKMVFMLNLMLLLENYSPMMYFVSLKQQFCMPLSILYFARPVWNHTTQWGSKLPTEGTFFWVGLHEK